MPAANRNDRWQAGRQATGRRLRVQIALFAVVFVAVTTLAAVRIVGDGLDPLWPLVGFAVGLIIGAVIVRSRSLEWDAPAHQVVSKLTVGGVVVTIAYLILLVLRDRIVGTVVSDAATGSVVGLTVTGGVMLGRVLVTARDIRRMLTTAGVLGDPSERATK